MTAKKIGKRIGRRFRGIWIPADIWLDKGLSGQEKVFLAEIDSLDNDEKGCRASNSYLAEFFSISAKRVSVVINKLIEKHRVSVFIDKGGGNVRYLRTLSPETGIALSLETGIGYPRKQGDPIPGNGETLNKDDNKGDNKEEEESPPVLSEKEEIIKMERSVLGGSKLSKEEAARFAYLNSKFECPGENISFFEFFEAEVLGRFDKFKVTPVVLKDWDLQLYRKYGGDIAAAAMSEYSTSAASWSPKLPKVLEIARKMDCEQKKRVQAQEAATRQAEDVEKLRAGSGKLRMPLCDQSNVALIRLLAKYRSEENNFMKSRVQGEINKRKKTVQADFLREEQDGTTR